LIKHTKENTYWEQISLFCTFYLKLASTVRLNYFYLQISHFKSLNAFYGLLWRFLVLFQLGNSLCPIHLYHKLLKTVKNRNKADSFPQAVLR